MIEHVVPVTAGCGLLFVSTTAAAQAPSSVHGVVTDSGNVPIYGASVAVAGTSLKVSTDEKGEFRVSGLASGTVALHFRRIGFHEVVRRIQLPPAESRLHVVMAPSASALKPLVVEAAETGVHGRLAGYYERMRRKASGQFITRQEIERSDAKSLSQLLSRGAGVSAFRLRSGGGTVRMRGASCRPLVWLDGVPMPTAEVDLDAFPVSTLHGIEVYLGSATVPSELQPMTGAPSCGAIALWSRGVDTERAKRRQDRTMELEQLVASMSVFTAELVDTPARLNNAQSIAITYPAELLAEGVSGSVLAEFVVDQQGKVEEGTLAIVSASHTDFGTAVADVWDQLRYSPALKQGKPVRQLVQQVFTFSARNAASRKRGQ